MAFCTSLEGQTVYSLVPYATSAFGVHSLLSAVLVVQLIVNGRRTFSFSPHTLFPC